MLLEKNSIYFSKWPKRIGFSLHQIVYCDRIVFEKDLWARRDHFLHQFQTNTHTQNFTTILLYNNKIWYVQTKWNSIFSVYLRFKKIKFVSRNELIHGRISYSFSPTWWNPFYGFECECSNLRASKLQKALLLAFELTLTPTRLFTFWLWNEENDSFFIWHKRLQCVWFCLQWRREATAHRQGIMLKWRNYTVFFFLLFFLFFIYIFIVQCAQNFRIL